MGSNSSSERKPLIDYNAVYCELMPKTQMITSYSLLPIEYPNISQIMSLSESEFITATKNILMELYVNSMIIPSRASDVYFRLINDIRTQNAFIHGDITAEYRGYYINKSKIINLLGLIMDSNVALGYAYINYIYTVLQSFTEDNPNYQLIEDEIKNMTARYTNLLSSPVLDNTNFVHVKFIVEYLKRISDSIIKSSKTSK
jgi:hypothetical protein